MSPPRAMALRSQPLIDLDVMNEEFRHLTAEQRVARALELLPGEHLLTSSFGAQAAVSLHLVTRAMPRVPVILIDTGYLFPETYRFIDELTRRLSLNLKIYRSPMSPAWQEARHGKLWEQGADGIERYNRMNKVDPMERALRDLDGGTWFAGLRREQSLTRVSIEPVQLTGAGRYKIHPIFDWTDRDVYRYLKRHALPYHPLWEQGYVSIGDWHTTRSLRDAGDDAEATRFFGLKRECGLHEINGSEI